MYLLNCCVLIELTKRKTELLVGMISRISSSDVSRYPAAGNCFQKPRYPAVRNFDQFSRNSSFNSFKNIVLLLQDHLGTISRGSKSVGRDPFNQNSNRSDREKRTTSKGGPVFSKLFRLDRTDPLSFGPKFPESLVEWIAPCYFTLIRSGKCC